MAHAGGDGAAEEGAITMASLINTRGESLSANEHDIFRITFAIVLFHALLWAAAPPFFTGSMHLDTLEVASWTSSWAWGYAKHPPLIVWLFKIAIAAPGSRPLKFLMLSQIAIGTTAFFVWGIVRLYASPRAAMIGLLIFLASPSANSFAVQVNHNTISMPFGFGSLFFGLRFLERRRSLDVALLGLIAGLGLLTKYQTAFFLVSLIVISIVEPRYRSVWGDPRGYVAAALCLIIFTPHVWWDYQHNWRTLLYASSDRPLRSFGDLILSLNELLDGLLLCVVGPVLAWLVLGCPVLRPGRGQAERIGLFIVALPVSVMIALGFATGQILRQGWFVPLLPGVAIALALIFATKANDHSSPGTGIAARAMALSIGQVGVFALFLLLRAASGSPVEAYSMDAKQFAGKVEAFWLRYQSGAVPCILLPNRSYGLAIMLHFDPIPNVVDFVLDARDINQSLAACRATGGLLITPENDANNAELDRMNAESLTIDVGETPWPYPYAWRFRIQYIAPNAP